MLIPILLIAGGFYFLSREQRRRAPAYVDNHGIRMYGACSRIQMIDDLQSEVYIDSYLTRYFERNPAGPQNRAQVEVMVREMLSGAFPVCANARPSVILASGEVMTWDELVDSIASVHLPEG